MDLEKPGEAPIGRKAWDAKRLADPNSLALPKNIRSRNALCPNAIQSSDLGNQRT